MVSVEAARKIYGVEVDPVTFAVNEKKTKLLRARKLKQWSVGINEKKLTVRLSPVKEG